MYFLSWVLFLNVQQLPYILLGNTSRTVLPFIDTLQNLFKVLTRSCSICSIISKWTSGFSISSVNLASGILSFMYLQNSYIQVFRHYRFGNSSRILLSSINLSSSEYWLFYTIAAISSKVYTYSDRFNIPKYSFDIFRKLHLYTLGIIFIKLIYKTINSKFI